MSPPMTMVFLLHESCCSQMVDVPPKSNLENFGQFTRVALADSIDEGAFAGQTVLMCKILFKLKGVEANNIIIADDGSAKTKPGSWRTARVIVKLSL